MIIIHIDLYLISHNMNHSLYTSNISTSIIMHEIYCYIIYHYTNTTRILSSYCFCTNISVLNSFFLILTCKQTNPGVDEYNIYIINI